MKTDAQVQQDVMAELRWEPSVKAIDIGVTVSNGTVTLTGEVGSLSEKWNIERVAQRVAGVNALAVEIEVTLQSDSRRSDADIASSAETVLQWMSYVTSDHVNVMVKDGWITLSGEVNWGYQRLAATAAVSHLTGVRGVSDQIGIRSDVSASAVKSDIEAALKRRAHDDSQKISVEVNGSEVTLTGTAHTWAERELATSCAWGSPGVRNVVDRITLAY